MANDARLISFVDAALRQGATKQDISETLIAAGWDKGEVASAVESFGEVKFSIPVPKKRSSLLARDFVFYLFLFAMLYAATFGLIQLIFLVLDQHFPEAESYGQTFTSIAASIRYWSAWSIVFVPAYLVMAWRAEQRRKSDPTCPMSTGRQWLTYLTLFLAGITALGDVVVLLNGFLAGETSIRFYLKILTVIIVAGAVLYYYARDIRDTEAEINRS